MPLTRTQTAFTTHTSLLKDEILILGLLPPGEWRHGLELRVAYQTISTRENFNELVYGMWRVGLLLEKPTAVLSEYRLTSEGERLRSSITQEVQGCTIQRCDPA